MKSVKNRKRVAKTYAEAFRLCLLGYTNVYHDGVQIEVIDSTKEREAGQ